MPSESSVTINGLDYTLIPYSSIDVDKNSILDDDKYITINGSINKNNILNPIYIPSNYQNVEIFIQVYDDDKFIFESKAFIADNVNINFDINSDMINGYKPIIPDDSTIDMPPIAPSF